MKIDLNNMIKIQKMMNEIDQLNREEKNIILNKLEQISNYEYYDIFTLDSYVNLIEDLCNILQKHEIDNSYFNSYFNHLENIRDGMYEQI